MNRFDDNDAGTRIYEDLENLTENELLELSSQLDPSCLPMPSAEGALDGFKRDYLPQVSEVSLYDNDKSARPVRRINIKTLLVAAVIAVLMVASSLVSYAAGAASNQGETNDRLIDPEQGEEQLRTWAIIDGIVGELFIVKPIEDFDFESYRQTRSVIDQSLSSHSDSSYDVGHHFVDEEGNLLHFENIKLTTEQREVMNKKAVDRFGEEASEYQIGDVAGETVWSTTSMKLYRADEYYFENLAGFAGDHSKVFAYCDTNFQLESTITIYAYCYNTELNVYQEFITSRTHMGGFDISFEQPDGWEIIKSEVVIDNSFIGRSVTGFDTTRDDIYGETSEDVSAFREMINGAIEKYQKEKEEKNDIINKIESGQDK